MKIYVASSWRNEKQPAAVTLLREAGHDVYDFRQPTEDSPGFHWSELDPDWETWSPTLFRGALKHPIAKAGYDRDYKAMLWADACLLVMPCGRSAHLEAGWFAGAIRPLVIWLADGEPELMYRMASNICVDEKEVLEAFHSIDATSSPSPDPGPA